MVAASRRGKREARIERDGSLEESYGLLVASLPIEDLPHDVAALRLRRVDLQRALCASLRLLERRAPAVIPLHLRGEIDGDRQHGVGVGIGPVFEDGAAERGHGLGPFSLVEVAVAQDEVLIGHG